MSCAAGVFGVVVSYNPDDEVLLSLVHAVQPQVQGLVVVDNGSCELRISRIQKLIGAAVTWIRLQSNMGVGAAQNQGIAWALNQKADYVLLLDQDSIPAAGMVSHLRKVAEEKSKKTEKVAACGPRYLDDRQNNRPPFVQVYGGRLHRVKRAKGEDACSVDYLISSGALIPRRALEVVGLMDESLFIDYVDIEWGLRALSKGYRSFGVWDAFMKHDLGDQPIKLFGRYFPARSPGRYYYMYRNAMVMFHKPHVPFRWCFVERYRLVFRAVVWVGFGPRRLESAGAILRGLIDGFRGVSGIDPGNSRL